MDGSVFQANIESMKSRYADVVELMQNPPEDVEMIEEDKDIISEVIDVSGKKMLIARKGDDIYHLDSLHDDDSWLDFWFEGLKDEWDLNSRLYMYGLGNGTFVRKFLQRARPDCAIVVHEPSYNIFRTVLYNYDLSDIFIDPRVRFVFWPLHIGVSVKSVYEDILTYTDIISLAGANYLNYFQLFPNDCSDYINEIERVKDFAAANQTVKDHFGAYFCKNTFSNMLLIEGSYDLQKLADLMPDNIPAIVVAAGPSLDKNIKEIAKAKGRCIIISTDTALKPLSLAGIVPDITAIMDGKKDEKYLSEEDSRKVPVVCTPRGGTEFLHLHTGKKFFVNDFSDHIGGFFKSVHREMLKLDSGGSVANACFAIAVLFHCKKIILVGQDLAYTGDKTHSSVTVRGAVETPIDELEHVVMDVDIYGNPIRSSGEFKLYKEWFEQHIDSDRSLEVIDATEGGIMIRGTKIMSLREAIKQYCIKEFDFSKIIDKAEPLLDDGLKLKYRNFIKNVPEDFVKLRSVIKMTRADYSAMRKLIVNNDYHNSRMAHLYNNCRVRTEEIENSPVIEYVHNQLQGKSTDLLGRVNKLEKDEKKELLTVCDLGEQYLRDMEQAINELEPYIDMIKRDFE